VRAKGELFKFFTAGIGKCTHDMTWPVKNVWGKKTPDVSSHSNGGRVSDFASLCARTPSKVQKSHDSQSRRVHGLNWLGTPNSGVPSDLEGGSITNLSRVNLQAPLRQALGLPEALVINTPLKLRLALVPAL